MKKLIDYILLQDRRLVSPVGGGSAERFARRIKHSAMKSGERMAHWMAFQAEEYGHDFLCSTILDVQICKCFGLKTFTLPAGSEHVLEGQINESRDLKYLKRSAASSSPLLSPYISCIEEFRKLSPKPIGGACFGPFTTAGAMLGTEQLCLSCIRNPTLLEKVLPIITDFIIQMANDCEQAGADFFWIAEPTAVLISPEQFREFSGQYIKKIFASISIPGFLHVPGDSRHLIDEFIHTGVQCLSLDSCVDMRDMAHTIPQDVVILGNINSISMLQDSVEEIEKKTELLNKEIKNFPNFIISSGGGLSQFTPEENIRALFKVTEKFPLWNKMEFALIDHIWHSMIEKSSAEVYGELSQGSFSREVIRAALEEACVYLGRQVVKKKISLSTYSQYLNEIAKLLSTEYLDSDCFLNFEENSYHIEQLKRNFINIMHSQYKIY